eukprot:XP_015574829.1 uncharacterized protein LOC8283960 isoform X1 [Ricinus communis]
MINPIDNIPKFKTRRRSPVTRRRSDFSSFFTCSSSSASGSNLGSFRHGLFSITMTGLDDTEDEEKTLPELPQLSCRMFADKKSKPLADFYETPVIGVESVAQNTIVDHSGDSNQRRTAAMEPTPEISRITESNGICATPGNVVWAKTDQQMWWPAEVIGETSSISDSRSQGIDGHVLVQFYGDHGTAWVDPARDISQLEYCFEERSCNTTDKFQDALKKALERKEDISSHGQLLGCSDGSKQTCQQNQSSGKRTSSISSRTESDYIGRRKSKRKEKFKICYDEVAFPPTAARKVRRFRMMRYLGLIAPTGSPF